MKKASVKEKINNKIGVMKGKSFLDELVFTKGTNTYQKVGIGHNLHLVDNNESITPTTDKGRLDIKLVYEKLEELKNLEKQKVVEIADKEVKETNIDEKEGMEFVSTMMLSKKSELIIPPPEIQFLENAFSFTEDETLFIKKYQYKNSETSQVLRLGINTLNDKIKQVVVTHNNAEHNLVKENNPALSNFSKIISKKDNLSTYIEYAEANITGIEKNIINYAKTILSVEHPSILLDLFARDDNNGHIKYNEDGSIETHTIVLYKQESKYLVIDPSKATFSDILIGAGNDVVICLDKEFQIYKPLDNKNIGYGQMQWRDCIDIAVKLAFYINKYNPMIELQEVEIGNTKEKYFVTERSSLQKCNFVEDITNNSAINQSLPSEIKMYAFRSQQSSDITEQKLSSIWLKVMHAVHKNVIDKVSALKLTLKDQDPFEIIIEKFFKSSFDSHKHSISELKNLISIDMMISSGSNKDEVVQLIGLGKLAHDHIMETDFEDNL